MQVIDINKLTKDIKWVLSTPTHRRGTQLRENEVAIGFYPSKKGGEKINRIRIKIGRAVVKKLKWKAKQNILVYTHPDDMMMFMLVKSENTKGYVLRHGWKSEDLMLTFTWHHDDFRLSALPQTVVDHRIPNENVLVFRAQEKDGN